MKRRLILVMVNMVLTICFSLYTPYLVDVGFAANKEPIIIGVIDSYTGPIALQAADVKNGIELAIEDINKKGGILGRPIKAIYEDAKLKPEISAQLARKLIYQKKVDILYAPAATTIVKPASEVAKKAKRLILTLATSNFLTEKEGHRYIFRLAPNNRSFAGGPAKYMTEHYPQIKKWVTISPNIAWGRECMENFTTVIEKSNPGATIVKKFWPPMGETDFSPYISAILGSDAEAVLNLTWASDLITLIRQAKPMGLFKKKKFVGYMALDVRRSLGKDMPEGIVGWDFSEVSDESFKVIANRFKSRFGKWPGIELVSYYSLISLMAGIEKAGTTENEKLIDALSETILEGTPWGSLRYNKYNQGNMGVLVGETKLNPNYPFTTFKSVKYYPGDLFLLSDDAVKKMR